MKKSLLSAACLLLMACTGSSGLSVDDFVAQLATVNCPRRVQCGDFPDEATCEKAYALSGLQGLPAFVNAGTVSYDGDAAERCLADIPLQHCDDTSHDENAQASFDCGTVIKGTVGANGACKVGYECVSGNCVTSCPGQCCTGLCTAPDPTLPVDSTADGMPCNFDDNCQVGHVCVHNDATGISTCQPPFAGGAACDGLPRHCAEGYVCIYTPTDRARRPVRFPAASARRASTPPPARSTCTAQSPQKCARPRSPLASRATRTSPAPTTSISARLAPAATRRGPATRSGTRATPATPR
jgi:hypothetical protein